MIINTINRTELVVRYENKDITNEISSYIKSFSYTDNSSDSVDDIALKMHDVGDVWKNDWRPTKGDTIEVYIKDLYCGIFEVDEIVFSGFPSEIEIKAVSGFVSKSIRKEKKTKAWEKVKLEQIVKDIADNNSMTYLFDVLSGDFVYDRVDQNNESDLSFIKRLCDDSGYRLKIDGNKIIVYEVTNYEVKDAVFEINRYNIKSYDLKTQSYDLYTSCKIQYFDENSNEVKNYVYKSDNENSSGQNLVLKKRVKSLAEAKRVAEAKLKEKNRMETTASFNIYNSDFYNLSLATICFNISGFGMFDGKYMIDKATHTVSVGYNISIDAHRVIEE